tara:strand:- start:71 stop:622 length:552 start_codon:yes stop_codon:yes gene_type:complete
MANQRLTDKTSLDNHTGSGDLYMIVDVSDTTGSTAGTSKKLDSKFVIQTDKISISSAEIAAMNDDGTAGARKTLVSAPGAGYMIQPISCTVIGVYDSGTENSNAAFTIGYNNAASTYYVWQQARMMYGVSGTETYVLTQKGASSTSTFNASIEDKGLFAYSSLPFNATWSATVYITYQIVKLS